jgi:hypothetical protein
MHLGAYGQAYFAAETMEVVSGACSAAPLCCLFLVCVCVCVCVRVCVPSSFWQTACPAAHP